MDSDLKINDYYNDYDDFLYADDSPSSKDDASGIDPELMELYSKMNLDSKNGEAQEEKSDSMKPVEAQEEKSDSMKPVDTETFEEPKRRRFFDSYSEALSDNDTDDESESKTTEKDKESMTEVEKELSKL